MRNNPGLQGEIAREILEEQAPIATRETIYAVSSGAGRAGVAVLRLSGAGAGAALAVLAGAVPPARQATLARLRHPADGALIDQGLVLWFPGPGSFTGEDVAELHLHGGRAVLAAALEALGSIPGLRPAEAGEFSRRAFDNGKLDLSQAEGLADLINAETEAQRRQGLQQLGGALRRLTDDWRTALVAVLAHLEAGIDFADEDLAPGADASVIANAAKHKMLRLKRKMEAHIDSSRRGERLRDGLSVTIIGAPNVGKSSLLNALARRDVAIISDVAGTTRDVVEVHLDLEGYPVTLADTAGLHREPSPEDPQAPVEAEGMRRTRARAAAADVKLAVFDIRRARNPDPDTLALIDSDTTVIFNKRDLSDADGPGRLRGQRAICVSAKTGAGMELLEKTLARQAAERLAPGHGSPVFTRARHRRALEDGVLALDRALAAPLAELAAEDVRLALRALGRVAGRVDVEDVLDVIFRDFCIGK